MTYINKEELKEWLNTCLNAVHCTDEEGETLDCVLDHVEWLDEYNFDGEIKALKAELAASQAEKEKVHNKLHSILRRHIEDRITAVELKNELLEILA